ncbi:MAG: 6-carboxytetrahydropterin synthase [Ignavibacteriae bacterium]|nr:6-carboxytetrahydropterin synthase [Ignavibacteriota bacterium]MCB9249159.1 6-carboxytetrahydropterin synthase [Ignavibacteriales bacterium]
MIYVTRREVFAASHRLHNENLTDEENSKIFGKCNNPNGHGHNYILEVVIAGEIDKTTGYVIDLKELKTILIENIIRKVDHKHLNFDVDFMHGINPTTENFAVRIWDELVDKIPSGKLHAIKLRETENNFIEYRGK